jgi:hypothetical protein
MGKQGARREYQLQNKEINMTNPIPMRTIPMVTFDCCAYTVENMAHDMPPLTEFTE